MNQNPIESVLDELQFTTAQKEGFWDFLKYAKVCQETGNNKLLKAKLEEIIKKITQNS